LKKEIKKIDADKLADNFAEIISFDPNLLVSNNLLWNLLESIPLNISIWQIVC